MIIISKAQADACFLFQMALYKDQKGDSLDSKQAIPGPQKSSLNLRYKPSSTTFWESRDKMAATVTAPVAIGTRGTVGSLVKNEIDYYAKIELERCCSSSSSSHRTQRPDMASSSCSSSPPTFWQSIMLWRRKKKRTGICFVPKMNKISGFGYTILRNDFHSFHM